MCQARGCACTRQEEEALRQKKRTAARDADHVTDEMRRDVLHLLQLFGLPFLVSPMEAEAQCATLEQLKLVDGVVTDDRYVVV